MVIYPLYTHMIHLAVYQSHGAGAGAGATEPQGAAAIAGHRAGHRSIRQAGRLGFPGGKRVGVLPSKMSKIKGLTIQNEGFYHPKWRVLPEFSVFRCLS